MAEVPCNGCTLCCKGDMVRILPHEDPGRWDVEPHPVYKGQWMLAHKSNGDCVYLGDSGCTRQGDKPQLCHDMDCRNIARAMTGKQAREVGVIGIWKQGKELMRSQK